MKKRVILVGIVLVAFGVITYAIFSSIISSQTIVVRESFTVLAGSNVPSSFHLPNDADVSGTINQVTGQTTNDIDFYVFDRANYQVWTSTRSSVWYIKIYRATSGATFSFRTAEDGNYYFVFDNPGVLFNGERAIVWSASYEYKPYGSFALPILVSFVAVGAILVAGTSILELKHRMEKLRTCPKCSRRIPIEKTICPHCGFDITKSVQCKYCHTFYDSSMLKCPNCGAQNK